MHCDLADITAGDRSRPGRLRGLSPAVKAKALSSGGSFDLIARNHRRLPGPAAHVRGARDPQSLSLVNFDKPVVSAIQGQPSVRMVVALLADISVAGRAADHFTPNSGSPRGSRDLLAPAGRPAKARSATC